ncbi:MAG: hypothetical protein ACI3Y4_08015 [Candidatus Cryptobacteroides sp.]
MQMLRKELLDSGIAQRLKSPEQVVQWVRDSLLLVEGRNPQNLRMPPQSVWRSRMTDRRSRRIFFVAMCRALGFPARIDEVAGKTQYRENGIWLDVDFDGAVQSVESPKGQVEFVCGSDPKYYRHFTLAKLEDGRAVLRAFGQDSDDTPLSSLDGILDEGDYVLTTGTRLSSGGVLAHLEFFSVHEGECTPVPVVLRQSEERHFQTVS